MNKRFTLHSNDYNLYGKYELIKSDNLTVIYKNILKLIEEGINITPSNFSISDDDWEIWIEIKIHFHEE